MSELNGDKARFQRLRKAKVRRHQRTRELWAAIRGGDARMHTGPVDGQPGGVRGRIVPLRPMTVGPVAE
jgi:hypothetical protein